MKNTKNCYVYAHVRKDTNKPFYIGIGCKAKFKRAFESQKRNSMWYKILNKSECFSNILFTDLSWKEACEIEINLINHLGRKNNNTGILCNFTDGGEGAKGVIFTEERKQKISKALTGRITSDLHKLKCRQRKQTIETINKIRLQKTGLKASEKTKAKMRITNMVGINAACEKIKRPVIDLQSGIYYSSVREAAKLLGITHGYLSGMLIGRYPNKTNLIYA